MLRLRLRIEDTATGQSFDFEDEVPENVQVDALDAAWRRAAPEEIKEAIPNPTLRQKARALAQVCWKAIRHAHRQYVRDIQRPPEMPPPPPVGP